jgi:hypothetical protein
MMVRPFRGRGLARALIIIPTANRAVRDGGLVEISA